MPKAVTALTPIPPSLALALRFRKKNVTKSVKGKVFPIDDQFSLLFSSPTIAEARNNKEGETNQPIRTKHLLDLQKGGGGDLPNGQIRIIKSMQSNLLSAKPFPFPF